MTLPVITIDGPAGAGKSTVAKEVAKALGLTYLDTGAMYRALTLSALKNNIDCDDELALYGLAQKTDIKLKDDQVFLNQEDVSLLIKEPAVSEKVSYVAKKPLVRQIMTTWQRDIAKEGGVVLDGRDMGSVVFPDADLKIYLTASIEERTKRRLLDLENKGIKIDFEELKQKIIERDKIDSEREVAPLVVPEGAHILDTTGLSIEEVVQEIVKKCRIE